MSSPSSSAQAARQALGGRLREIRLDAGLTARALGQLMGRHPAKISRIEHGTTSPSAEDIQAWCVHCNARNQASDLIASLRAVEGMWIEWRRMERTGLRQAQESRRPLYERTRSFRVYSPALVPGIIQTPAYTTAILTAIGRRRSLPDDISEAVAVRMDRQRYLHEGDHRFAVLIEESALRSGIGGIEVMAAQLAHLIVTAALPTVSLGIVPARPDRDAAWTVEGFWIFDDVQVAVELVSGHLTITQPREIEMYAQVYAELAEIAVYGPAARSIITAAIDALGA
ncbi:helix-turn-helix domain-containing protein [Virgisporangium aurantiacum]|uniref:Transcriptional regulator n=1 Tax=Virgisporangium aurantiacum TaxID=175570 RepID=A0A8J3ZHN9_9ACTN|nr:helix-turn-helix transcriptional regulator [Virgisporangium aurantiacum]GIJ63097.1 transcriptional regulator [Virgisporangium aurantiacum]